ncbi:MAG: NAD(P)/FAD-dependent oxidoreductase, partial [Gammaproteobacteria bacterium]|nr:NAD(P)/FAD-dependent oxidoreductase [Gammaproteobacteria bacterium]
MNRQVEGAKGGDTLDVLIVGAGISGISAACHLVRECPDKSFAMLEARDEIGGTWDLFRFPGIRSDSDMYTFGFSFKPWTNPQIVSEADNIRDYLGETVDEFGIRDHIRFGHRVASCEWDSETSTWTAAVTDSAGKASQIRARFLFLCCGYYRYDEGYTPELSGLADFAGTVVHPQHWPEDLDFTGKRMAVIGSGATAVTLIPALAEKAAKVTMIQRSPSYIVSRPGRDFLANAFNALLPPRRASAINRWRFTRQQDLLYRRSRNRPEAVKDYLIKRVRKVLGADYDVEKHFTPTYEPWTQRVCLVPDNDLFLAIRDGKADVVTGAIERIAADSVRMRDGETVEADILVTATGLNLQLFGGIRLFRDGAEIDPTASFNYQGMMLSGVPNLAYTFGYVNASWTLRADLNSRYVCKLLKAMD